MEALGTFTAYIHCVGMRGMAVVTVRKLVATQHSVTHSEAVLMQREHSKQANLSSNPSSDYEYQWQANPVALLPSSY